MGKRIAILNKIVREGSDNTKFEQRPKGRAEVRDGTGIKEELPPLPACGFSLKKGRNGGADIGLQVRRRALYLLID